MLKVIVYTASHCSYCKAAKEFLRNKNVVFEEIDVTDNPAERKNIEKLSGQKTVPQIFINGRSIGGFSDMRTLDENGELDKLLRAC
ncbi:MAG: glutaredoxin 3 [Deltaproteobacteria bacterium]|nr:glutaredoxin 3 [Deltaproteobacteria bacterium]